MGVTFAACPSKATANGNYGIVTLPSFYLCRWLEVSVNIRKMTPCYGILLRSRGRRSAFVWFCWVRKKVGMRMGMHTVVRKTHSTIVLSILVSKIYLFLVELCLGDLPKFVTVSA